MSCKSGIYKITKKFNIHKASVSRVVNKIGWYGGYDIYKPEKKSKYTNRIDKDKLIELVNLKYDQYKIAKMLNVSQSGVCRALKKYYAKL